MARRILVPTKEMGEIQLLLIDEMADGTWDPDWEPIRQTIIGEQIPTIPKEALDHLLHGWSKPFVDILGIPPEGALRKIPKPSRVCVKRSTCPFHEAKKCHTESEDTPWCFEPDNFSKDEFVRQIAWKVIEEWRNRTYLIVVRTK